MKVVVRALVRWSWLLVLCLIVGWLGGRGLATLNPPTYQATSYIQLNAQSRTSGIVQPVAVYASMITSDVVLGQVLKNYPRLSRQVLSAKQLVVTVDDPSQTVSIQVTLPDAKIVASLANNLAQLLVTQQNKYIKSLYDRQLQLFNQQIADEQKVIDTLNQRLLQTPITNVTAIQQYQSQVAQHQGLQTQSITDRQTLLTQQVLYSDPLTITQLATIPTRPATLLGLISFVPLTLVLTLVLGLIAIFLLESKIGRINNIYLLQQKLSLPVLGALCWMRPGPDDIPLSTICDDSLPYAEECRVMMADILFHAEEAQAHVLAIIGTRSRAGSSTIAAQLAVLLAHSKRRVLLIDANLHAPSLHDRLDITNQAGLAHMLEEARQMNISATPGSRRSSVEVSGGISPVDHYVLSTGVQNLYALPAGQSTVNASSLLSMPEMSQFLKWTTRGVDYIVIDCPSIVHADAHVLGALCDQTFLVVDATRDRLGQILHTKEELVSTGVKLSGLIVNKLGRWI